ncbi:hypothetical protein [Bradyrhizobium brasilense]|uniref:hypothetical protein n=1 Tax=Bradyrhizobium brasilense TaxID=1419277 RepID=UPI001E502CC6|nr:hypothetical protein [Bradyrhizobium brasilense]MCC8969516.1 hypothetical protein [Bradyrhizobium brasilense]
MRALRQYLGHLFGIQYPNMMALRRIFGQHMNWIQDERGRQLRRPLRHPQPNQRRDAKGDGNVSGNSDPVVSLGHAGTLRPAAKATLT